MNYQTFEPHPDLSALVKCYWILEVPGDMNADRQRIVPDGCIELFFILGEDVKRFTSDDSFILQPRSMVLGQITRPFFIQPTGYVHTFAIRFYPYGFANFVEIPIQDLANTETPISSIFGAQVATALEQKIVNAGSTEDRIRVIEEFLLQKLAETATIDHIVKSTIDMLVQTKGSQSISSLLEGQHSLRRSLERKFSRQVGISPKQLGKVIRLQSALKLLLTGDKESLTSIAYQSEYYDQAHFIKDFKEFTGTNPKDFLNDEQMILSSLIYSKD